MRLAPVFSASWRDRSSRPSSLAMMGLSVSVSLGEVSESHPLVPARATWPVTMVEL